MYIKAQIDDLYDGLKERYNDLNRGGLEDFDNMVRFINDHTRYRPSEDPSLYKFVEEYPEELEELDDMWYDVVYAVENLDTEEAEWELIENVDAFLVMTDMYLDMD